jgi:hypothetical protein
MTRTKPRFSEASGACTEETLTRLVNVSIEWRKHFCNIWDTIVCLAKLSDTYVGYVSCAHKRHTNHRSISRSLSEGENGRNLGASPTHGRIGARYQAMRSPAGTLPYAPPLERRPVPSVHPSAGVERASAALSSMSASPYWTMGDIAISPQGHTLLGPSLYADLQRPPRSPAASASAPAVILDARHLAGVSRLFVPAHRQRAAHAWPDQRPLVRVAAQGSLVLCEAPSTGRHRRLEGTVDTEDLSHTAGAKGHAQRGGKKALGRCARGRRTKRESGRGHDVTDRPARIAWISRVLSVPAERPSLEGVWAGRTGLAGGLRAV